MVLSFFLFYGFFNISSVVGVYVLEDGCYFICLVYILVEVGGGVGWGRGRGGVCKGELKI